MSVGFFYTCFRHSVFTEDLRSPFEIVFKTSEIVSLSVWKEPWGFWASPRTAWDVDGPDSMSSFVELSGAIILCGQGWG